MHAAIVYSVWVSITPRAVTATVCSSSTMTFGHSQKFLSSGFKAHALDTNNRFWVLMEHDRGHRAVDHTGLTGLMLVFGSPVIPGSAWLSVGYLSHRFATLASAGDETALVFHDPISSAIVVASNAMTVAEEGAFSLANVSDRIAVMIPIVFDQIRDLSVVYKRYIRITLLCGDCQRGVVLQRSVAYKDWGRGMAMRWSHDQSQLTKLDLI